MNKYMLVFGGDRHRMPFNDLYVLDLQTEYADSSYLFDGTHENSIISNTTISLKESSVVNL